MAYLSRSENRRRRKLRDLEWVSKKKEQQKIYEKNNKNKRRERQRRYILELNKFKNKHCTHFNCNKLLNYKNISGYCGEHYKLHSKGCKKWK